MVDAQKELELNHERTVQEKQAAVQEIEVALNKVCKENAELESQLELAKTQASTLDEKLSDSEHRIKQIVESAQTNDNALDELNDAKIEINSLQKMQQGMEDELQSSEFESEKLRSELAEYVPKPLTHSIHIHKYTHTHTRNHTCTYR